MKKTYFKKIKKLNKKVSVEYTILENKEDALSFSLTPEETNRYIEWTKSLRNDIVIDEEDMYILYPDFKFSPFELGVRIQVSVGKDILLLRSAWENDKMKLEKKVNKNDITHTS